LREHGFLTSSEAAKKLGVSAATIYNLARAGLINRHLYGNNYSSLYELPGTSIYIKGRGGRRSKQPNFIDSQHSQQGAI
jgi:excisionase family DNA binding protein